MNMNPKPAEMTPTIAGMIKNLVKAVISPDDDIVAVDVLLMLEKWFRYYDPFVVLNKKYEGLCLREARAVGALSALYALEDMFLKKCPTWHVHLTLLRC